MAASAAAGGGAPKRMAKSAAKPMASAHSSTKKRCTPRSPANA
jgi:hypothetical protein